MDLFQGVSRDLLLQGTFYAAFQSLSYGAKKTVVNVLATRAGKMFGPGGVGLALFTYDFAVCLVSGTQVPDPGYDPIDLSGPTGPGGGTNTNIFLPTPLPTPYIFYQSNYSLLGQYIPHLATPIFFNNADNKYYLDGTFSSFVPDGYYDSQSETVNYLRKYYHIINGSVTQTLSIIVDPNGPTGQ